MPSAAPRTSVLPGRPQSAASLSATLVLVRALASCPWVSFSQIFALDLLDIPFALRIWIRGCLGWFHFESGLECNFSRRVPNHDVERARNHHPLHVAIKELQVFRSQREGHCLLLTGLERNSLKTTQLFYRSRHGGKLLMEVKLHRFHSGALTCVLD